MNHADHVNLIKKAGIQPNTIWADLGSGDGAFTLALREIGGSSIQILSIDKDSTRLENQKKEFSNMFSNANIMFLNTDFRTVQALPLLDGILMANSLHFIENKKKVLNHILKFLKPSGTFVLVEYDSNEGNVWVPHPISAKNFIESAEYWGLTKPVFLHREPSYFMNSIYSAKSHKKS